MKNNAMAQPLGRYLPDELLFEILAHLPVKSLVRFRIVSRSWHSLIDDPAFVDRHKALSEHNFARKRIVTGYEHFREDSRVKPCPLRSLNIMELDDPSDAVVVSHLDAPRPPHPHDPVYVVGSDNGIVCILNFIEVYLWNPSTRQQKKLPPMEEHGKTLYTYGFGYASLVDDYKVVCISENAEVWVYSLKNKSWRHIDQGADDDFPTPEPFCLSMELLNGALHWKSTKTDPSIVSFDLCTETYRNIPIYFRHNPDNLTFGVWRGCLCVLEVNLFSEREFWVMKEYGVAESWHHYATILPPSGMGFDDMGIDRWGGRTAGKIINSCTERDEILIQSGPLNFTWYSTRDKTYRHTPLQGPTSYNLSARVYVESLVSLA